MEDCIDGKVYVVIQYRGDSTKSIYKPHGNSLKQTKIFIRTKPSLLQELGQQMIYEEPHKVYKEYIASGEVNPKVFKEKDNKTKEKDLNSENEEETTKNQVDKDNPVKTNNINAPITGVPRNLKQLHNVKAKTTNNDRLSRDAIFNAHEIAYDDLSFTWKVQTIPDLVVIVGLKDMLKELQTVIDACKTEEQLLGYDTTLSLGDFYVSVLLYKHTLFNEEPVIPSLFLIHERKFTSHHKLLFEVLRKEITGLRNIPIVTDNETAIINAIESETKLFPVGCHRHLRNDIKRWLCENGVEPDKKAFYIADVQELLLADSYLGYTKLYNTSAKKWSVEFRKYFESSIRPRLDRYAKWAIGTKCNFHPINGITNNICEGFNYLLKNLQKFREVPLDTIMLAFKMLQTYHLNEVDRGLSGLGNYSLKKKFLTKFQVPVQKLRWRQVCNPQQIVDSLKRKVFESGTSKKNALDIFPSTPLSKSTLHCGE